MSNPNRLVPRPGHSRLLFLALGVVLLGWSAAPVAGAPSRIPAGAPPEPAADGAGVARYESFYKARALGQVRSRELPETGNQASYDVHYYNLDLHPDPTTQVLTGTVEMRASVVSGPLTSLELDLESSWMSVTAVTSAGIPVAFTHAADLLTVQLDRSYATGEGVDVVVQYHGMPQNSTSGAFAFDMHGGQPMIWTLSEPFGARAWWPCKDQPADKADSVDLRVTVPSGMKTASNGTRIESSDNGTVAVTRWRERYPIATYLVSVTSFAFTTYSDWYHSTPADSMEIQFYLFPEDNTPGMTAVSGKVKGMITAYAARFGPYPFLAEKYGHAEFLWGGGMEHQTCTSLGSFTEAVVAHELGHQWWGDGVTCRDFHHIWLNEGFATYCEALWAESMGGVAASTQRMVDLERYYGPGTIYCSDLTDVNRIFDTDLSYRKPSWVLHMLRHVMGDTTFFTALRAYRQQFPYGAATTEDFQHVCESVSGRGLSRFFQEWIYGEYYPQYAVWYVSSPAGGGYDVAVHLQQVQPWQLFWMPVDLTIHTASGDSTFVAQDSLATQTFTFHVPAAPISVVIDKGNWILQQIVSPVAVDLPPTAAPLRLLAPAPNPTPRGAEITFSLPRAGDTRVSLLDAAGRRVAELHRGPLAAGQHHVEWDGRGADGHLAAGGIYWVSVEHDGVRLTRKLAVIR